MAEATPQTEAEEKTEEKKPEPFKPPELTGEIKVPGIVEGATAGYKPYMAKPETMEKLGFPGELREDWKQAAIDKMGELLKKYKSLAVYMDICVKCGACTDKCQFFLGSKDPNNMPVARAELFRKVYRKHFTLEGKVLGKLAGAEDLTEELLADWYSYFHQCSQCRRCSLFCPYGIDTAEISMAAREILDHIGMGQKYVNDIIVKVHEVGNNLGMNPKALGNAVEFVEEEIEEETEVPVKLPVDVEGAEVLMVTPSADFFGMPHMESLVGYAKVFHQAGISWTFSSAASEAGNFGLFIGNYDQMEQVAARVRDAIQELKPRRIVIGECGHAWRVAYAFWNTLIGPFDSLDPDYPRPQHIVEYTLDLVKRGALSLDRSANDEFVVTYHDSCNVARATNMGDRPGGQFEMPRELIKAVCNRYVDMDQETIRERTFCCGGGGGLLTDEILDVRVQGATPRMEAFHNVQESHDVNFMAVICAICKAQFSKVMPKFGAPANTVGGVLQLVSNAIVLGDKE